MARILSLERAGDEPTDEALVARAQGGDRWAEEMIFRRHVSSITLTALRMLGSRSDAEDVVQDTFAVALSKLDSLRDPSALRPWLLQIAVRHVHRYFRRRRMLSALGLVRADDASLPELARPDATPEVRAELALLQQQLDKLKPQLRIPWMLRYVEGLDLKEVASACDCSLATIKRRIAEADARVRKHISMGGPHHD